MVNSQGEVYSGIAGSLVKGQEPVKKLRTPAEALAQYEADKAAGIKPMSRRTKALLGVTAAPQSPPSPPPLPPRPLPPRPLLTRPLPPRSLLPRPLLPRPLLPRPLPPQTRSSASRRDPKAQPKSGTVDRPSRIERKRGMRAQRAAQSDETSICKAMGLSAFSFVDSDDAIDSENDLFVKDRRERTAKPSMDVRARGKITVSSDNRDAVEALKMGVAWEISDGEEWLEVLTFLRRKGVDIEIEE